MSLAEIKAHNPLFGGSSTLEACTFLDLASISLSVVPDAIGSLGQLKDLNLSGNKITSLPSTFAQLTGLTSLSLSDNPNLTALPSELSCLTDLVTIYIYGCNISRLPEWVVKLSNLKCIYAEKDGVISLKMAPEGIKDLPCWSNTSRPLPETKLTVSQMLKGLKIYGPDSSLLERINTRKASEHSGLLRGTSSPTVASSSVKSSQTGGEIRGGPQFIDPRSGQAVVVSPEMVGILRAHSNREISSRDVALYSARAKNFQSPRLFRRNLENLDEQVSSISCLYGVLCGICFQILDAPKKLPCGHNFCKACLHLSLKQMSIDGLCSCPICRSSVWLTESGIESLDDSSIHQDAIERAQLHIGHQRNEYVIPKCKIPGCDALAANHCKECGFFCQNHISIHALITKDHERLVTVVSADGLLENAVEEDTCRLHRQKLEMICLDCVHVPLQCSRCDYEQHAHKNEDHRRFELDTGSNSLSSHCLDLKGKLNSRKNIIDDEIVKLSNRKLEIDQEYLLAETRRSKFFEDLIAKIQRLEQLSQTQLEHLVHVQQEELGYHIDDLIHQQHSLETILSGFDQQLSISSDKQSMNLISNLLASALSHLKAGMPSIQLCKRTLQAHLPFHLLDEMDNHLKLPPFSLKSQAFPLATVQSEMMSTHFWGVAYQPASDSFFTCNEDHGTITVWNSTRQPTGGFHTSISIRQPWQHPRSIACSPQGLIATVDAGDGTVKVWSRNLDLVRVFWPSLDGENTFRCPASVCFDSRGRLFVADGRDNSIHMWTPDWMEHERWREPMIESRIQESWTQQTPRPHSVGQITSIAANKSDEILILRAGWTSISVVNAEGRFVRTIPTSWTSVDRWASVTYLSDDTFAVCDFGLGTIIIYMGDGSIQRSLDEPGCISACLGPRNLLCVASYSKKAITLHQN